MWGVTFGGLHQKILSVLLIFLLVLMGINTYISFSRGRNLSVVVSDSREEQHRSIEKVSGEAMQEIIEDSMLNTNELQAYMADDIFSDVKAEVLTLQMLATSVFEGERQAQSVTVEPPDPANDGILTAQVLTEAGVDYASSEYFRTASGLADIMKAIYENSDKINNCYFGLADGTHIVVDKNSANKFDILGNLMPFPVRERTWYTGAMEKGGVCFSGVLIDRYSGKLCVSCSAPVYRRGEPVGVVGADIFLDSMTAYIDRTTGDNSFVCMVNGEGKVIFAPDSNGIFSVKKESLAEDIRKSENKELAAFAEKALREQTGITLVEEAGKHWYMTATPMNTVGWTLITVTEQAKTLEPADRMLAEVDSIDRAGTETFRHYMAGSNRVYILLLMITLFVGMIAALILANGIVRPVSDMTRTITENSVTGSPFEMKELYRTHDEIEVLALAFDDLSRQTRKYVEDITRITKEKERIDTELDLARKIQADMLPTEYPPFPDRDEFDIYAVMDPAKEVAGDFYDYFLIDGDHLAIVMADVSGKGVPAALFMMMSMIIIKNTAMDCPSPAKVLEKVNDILCTNNEEEMFVTVWLGILEISTGKITAANAGHEYPVIKRAEGDFELLQDKHGFVVGGMKGMKYRDYEIQLGKGDQLFLYTDGLPEATDADEEMFGTERMIEVMNRNKGCTSKELLENIRRSVDDFVGEAEQFDDLTMLIFTLSGRQSRQLPEAHLAGAI